MKANDIHVWQGNAVLIDGLGRFGSFRPESDLAHIVQTLAGAIHRKNHYLAGRIRETNWMDRDLSGAPNENIDQPLKHSTVKRISVLKR